MHSLGLSMMNLRVVKRVHCNKKKYPITYTRDGRNTRNISFRNIPQQTLKLL